MAKVTKEEIKGSTKEREIIYGLVTNDAYYERLLRMGFPSIDHLADLFKGPNHKHIIRWIVSRWQAGEKRLAPQDAIKDWANQFYDKADRDAKADLMQNVLGILALKEEDPEFSAKFTERRIDARIQEAVNYLAERARIVRAKKAKDPNFKGTLVIEPPQVSYTGLERITSSNPKELEDMKIKPFKWAIPGILPHNAHTIFAGAPRAGKSYIAMYMATALAAGTLPWPNLKLPHRFQPTQFKVLYLDLESNWRRIRHRSRVIRRQLGITVSQFSDNLQFELEWTKLHQGGLEKLRTWIEANKQPQMLIVIDVLTVVLRSTENYSYSKDHETVKQVSALCVEYPELTILSPHHTTKKPPEELANVFDSISGTQGIRGGADGSIVLTRENTREGANRVLHIEGRDIPDMEGNPQGLYWDNQAEQCHYVGPVRLRPKRLSPEMEEILNLFDAEACRMTPKQVGENLPHIPSHRRAMRKLDEKGLLKRLKTGEYELA